MRSQVMNFLTVTVLVVLMPLTVFSFKAVNDQSLNQTSEDLFITQIINKKIATASRKIPAWQDPILKAKYASLLSKYVKFLKLDLSKADLLLQLAQSGAALKTAKLNIETSKKNGTMPSIESLQLVNLVPRYNDIDNVISRIFESSFQFMNCEDMNDWSCLEKHPEIDPILESRQEISSTLGNKIEVNSPFKANVYFTNRWKSNACREKSLSRIKDEKLKIEFTQICKHIAKNTRENREVTVAKRLSEKIDTYATKKLYMAIYGIDDIENTMKDVFNSIKNKKEQGVDIISVVDVTEEGAPNSFLRDYDVSYNPISKSFTAAEETSLDYSYIKPENEENWIFGRPKWMEEILSVGTQIKSLATNLSAQNEIAASRISAKSPKIKADIQWLMGLSSSANGKSPNAQRMTFQYDGTKRLMDVLNKDATSNEQASSRIEYPMNGIMHNKFMVMENDKGDKYLWSGTTNIAKTCMGDESNSNIAIFTKNNEIADIFIQELLEMYTPVKRDSPLNLVTGKFHADKKPDTPRYLSFNDGTEVRIHFSPTDDGEHRVLIPMLLSAKAGDRIRISMFGGSGTELVRAMQWAASQGAHIQIVFDSATGSGTGSWTKDSINVLDKNPYVENPKGSIEVRYNNWPGLNHHKSATLTRYEGKNILGFDKYRPELLTLGSQNWSQSGNDENDENMMTIQNKTKALDVAKHFNIEFDQYMWKLSIPASLEKETFKVPPIDNAEGLLKTTSTESPVLNKLVSE